MPTTNQRLELQPSERVRSIKRLKVAIAKQSITASNRKRRRPGPDKSE